MGARRNGRPLAESCHCYIHVAPRTGTAGPATVLSDAMAVLWFIHADAMYGFPAYELPLSDIIRKLGGEAYFKFLCRLDQAPERAREHNRDHVATYHRVLLELSAGEARSDGGLGSMNFRTAVAKSSPRFWVSRTLPLSAPTLNPIPSK